MTNGRPRSSCSGTNSVSGIGKSSVRRIDHRTGSRLQFGHKGIRWLGGTTPAAHWDRRVEPHEKTAEHPRGRT
jgi:hypothetical protein